MARVNGASIGVDDIRELALRTGLSAREALARLEDERLLVEAAAARGYAQSPAVEQHARRALVQALLARTVEAEIRPETIPLSEVRERFDSAAERNGLSADTFTVHQAAIRQQLSREQRQQALEKLLRALRASIPVQLDESKVRALLSDPTLWGGSS